MVIGYTLTENERQTTNSWLRAVFPSYSDPAIKLLFIQILIWRVKWNNRNETEKFNHLNDKNSSGSRAELRLYGTIFDNEIVTEVRSRRPKVGYRRYPYLLYLVQHSVQKQWRPEILQLILTEKSQRLPAGTVPTGTVVCTYFKVQCRQVLEWWFIS